MVSRRELKSAHEEAVLRRFANHLENEGGSFISNEPDKVLDPSTPTTAQARKTCMPCIVERHENSFKPTTLRGAA